MKRSLLPLIVCMTLAGTAFPQNSIDVITRRSFYEKEWENWKASVSDRLIYTDTNIDIKFYHLDVAVAIDSHYISGNVYIRFKPVVIQLNSIVLDLHSSMHVDSVGLNAASFSATGDQLHITLTQDFLLGQDVEIKIWYHGKPLLAGGLKGLVYSTHGVNEPVIATLSTPFLSHYWWPCKDGPQDKADSAWVDITIKDTVVNGFSLKAVSNGILAGVDSTSGVYKTFRWKHGYPIVPYYIMVAISNYRVINQQYNGVSSSFPLIYYVFNASYNSALTGVSGMPDAFDLYSSLFGDYPFKNEKYGMTQLGFYGAIENQTNTIINTMDMSWFMISVHELSHMWFGDMITCKDWHHVWMNEGFASYCEALFKEYRYGPAAYHSYMTGFEFYDGGTVYLPSDTNAFGIFKDIVYLKGAYVLHMLRHVLGDTVFFDCLSTYANTPQFLYGHASTEDFRGVCETVSGEDLQYFFDQWIYDERYPVYHYNFITQPADTLTMVTIVQRQGIDTSWRPVFQMPLDLKFRFSNGNDTTVRVWNTEQYQNYSFSFRDSVTNIIIDPDKWVLKNAVFDSTVHVGVHENTGPPSCVSVYPNPANTEIYVKRNYPAGTIAAIEISSLSGQRMMTMTSNSNETIKTGSLAPGVYLLRYRDGNYFTVKKIVIAR